MAELSEKYIAGFLDADGSIQVVWRHNTDENKRNGVARGYLSLEFTQLTRNDEVLQRIKNTIGGCIVTNDERKSSTLKLQGSEAVKVLSRIEKYLVVKRHYARVVLELVGKDVPLDQAKAYLKAQRKVKGPLPNYPSRKWLAGYFDGDGSFQVRIGKGRTSAQPVAAITASAYDAEGVELLAKCFGGSLAVKNNGGDDLVCWTLTMPPSKVKQFVGYFAAELITKQDQARFLLGCAEMGHFRDGESIKSALKQLKAQPHRLSEPKADVPALLATVRDLPNPRPDIARRVAAGRTRTRNGTFV